MTRNFIFPQSITLSRPHSHFVTFPLVYHESFMLLWGDRRGSSPFRWRSRNQQVPCESLVVKRSLTFLLQRKLPRCGARSSTKGRFAESSVRSKVPNLSFLPRNKAASRFSFCGLMPPTLALTFLLREKSAKAYLRGFPLDIPWGLCPRSNRKRSRSPLSVLHTAGTKTRKKDSKTRIVSRFKLVGSISPQ